MPALFHACLAGVTGRAKALQVVQIETEFRMSADRKAMIYFKPSARATLDATPSIAAERFQSQRRPTSGANHMIAVAFPGHTHCAALAL
jgi:hypothetical protein